MTGIFGITLIEGKAILTLTPQEENDKKCFIYLEHFVNTGSVSARAIGKELELIAEFKKQD
jgi:hypothetical protein